MPKSRLEFWLPKLENNIKRDKIELEQLLKAGWETMIIWECQLKNMGEVRDRVMSFLEGK